MFCDFGNLHSTCLQCSTIRFGYVLFYSITHGFYAIPLWKCDLETPHFLAKIFKTKIGKKNFALTLYLRLCRQTHRVCRCPRQIHLKSEDQYFAEERVFGSIKNEGRDFQWRSKVNFSKTPTQFSPIIKECIKICEFTDRVRRRAVPVRLCLLLFRQNL